MGGFFGKLFSGKDARLLMLGLDNAGKTKILYRMKLQTQVTTLPTVGFNVETVKFKNFTFNIWDVGGQERIRPLWRHYFVGTQALIFVVDSADDDRIDEAKSELHRIIDDRDMSSIVVAIFANKQDMANAMRPDELEQRFELSSISKRQTVRVFATSAENGSGLQEGFTWISDQLKKKK